MNPTSGQGGKDDTYRPVDTRKYEKNYLRIYGKKCPDCLGTGQCTVAWGVKPCPNCDGIGYLEK